MIQEILKNLSPDLTNDLVKSFNLSSDQASETISTTKNSLVGSLIKEASTGNFDRILEMFNQSSGLTSNPMVKGLLDNLAKNYSAKLGLTSEKAQSIASFVLPKIISAISDSKSGDFGKDDIMALIGASSGDAIKNTATDVLKKGLGNFFK